MSESNPENVVVVFDHDPVQQRLVFESPPPPIPLSRRPAVTVSEFGNIHVDFGTETLASPVLVFQPPEGLALTGFVAGPAARRTGGASRVWRVGEEGAVDQTPFQVVVKETEIFLTIKYVKNDSFFYLLLYTVGGQEFICDPEITNDGDPGVGTSGTSDP